MRKIFQKYRILKPSEEFLTLAFAFKSIQNQDALVSCVAVMKL